MAAQSAGYRIVIILALVLFAAVPLGNAFMARVYAGERTFLTPVFGPSNASSTVSSEVDETKEQSALGYTLGMLAFGAAGFALLYALLRLQEALLPLKPARLCRPHAGPSPSTPR